MNTISGQKKDFGDHLVLDELFDLSLYRELRKFTSGTLQKTLDELIPVEMKHYQFWQDFFKKKIQRLNFGRRIKLALIISVCRIFGETAIYLVLEAIEIHGIRKYLSLWEMVQNTPLAEAVRTVLKDEFEHEDNIVTGYEEKKISPERVRVIFLGFNDGLVEFVGAVGGFFAAFHDTRSVLIASLTGAAAGALSMAVGVFASSSSEAQMQKIDLQKQKFLSGSAPEQAAARPLSSAVMVAIAYMFGAMVPILPVVAGAQSVLATWICGGIMVIVLTAVLSFISGIPVRKRVLTNLVMVFFAVAAAYAVGVFAKSVLGMSLL